MCSLCICKLQRAMAAMRECRSSTRSSLIGSRGPPEACALVHELSSDPQPQLQRPTSSRIDLTNTHNAFNWTNNAAAALEAQSRR